MSGAVATAELYPPPGSTLQSLRLVLRVTGEKRMLQQRPGLSPRCSQRREWWTLKVMAAAAAATTVPEGVRRVQATAASAAVVPLCWLHQHPQPEQKP